MSVSTPSKSEFTVKDAYQYPLSSAPRWILAHVWRYKWIFLGAVLFSMVDFMAYSQSPVLVGKVAGAFLEPDGRDQLLPLALAVLGAIVLSSLAFGVGSLMTETIAQHLEADSRHELYTALLGKSQTFHNRQRVGDIMARATDDVRQLNFMVSPGFRFIYESVIGIIVPLVYIGLIRMELLVVPVLFVLTFIVLLRDYTHRLEPVMDAQRETYGKLNAGLEESISGIEIVKASVQEAFERMRFRRTSHLYRDYFVKQGKIEAAYLPLLVFGFALGGTFLHTMVLYQNGTLGIPDIIAVMGLMNVLRFPAFMSIWSFSVMQMGLASADRIVSIVKAETELDENTGGHASPIEGGIVFENVSFCYHNGDDCDVAVIEDVSFHIRPGQTVAIVGQTGSGKSTLAQLINRTYDVTSGRVLIDGVDVREWDLDALRSQISKIEQDVFLFSRSVADNIAFGAPDTPMEQIQQAAREAQAHDFIMSFEEGYDTKIGERGVMLSGGQRQRLALARAFLSDPRILILDDSTSAIDSATEDDIQKAIRRAQQGRTTLLITHRLSQIRWADLILVLDHGQLVAAGSHEDLLRTSPGYRRIFARYDVELPPLEAPASQSVYVPQEA